MIARFIEDMCGMLGVKFVAESEEERLLLRVFSQQAQANTPANLLEIRGWGHGPENGIRELRLYRATPVPIEGTDDGTPG
jgi:hypothetical protein